MSLNESPRKSILWNIVDVSDLENETTVFDQELTSLIVWIIYEERMRFTMAVHLKSWLYIGQVVAC